MANEFNVPCELCFVNDATDKHHLFSNTKPNRKAYGKLLDNTRNIIYVCNGCHTWKSIPKLNEIEFCEIMGITPRTKSGLQLWKRRNG